MINTDAPMADASPGERRAFDRLKLRPLGTRGKSRSEQARESTVVTESSEQNSVAAITAEIVSAYVSHNQIATAELAGLISAVERSPRAARAAQGRPA